MPAQAIHVQAAMLRSGRGHGISDTILTHMPHMRGERTSHWCRGCVLKLTDGELLEDHATGRIRVAAVRTKKSLEVVVPDGQLSLMDSAFEVKDLTPVRVSLVSISAQLMSLLVRDPGLLYRISPDQLEELVCDRLFEMGLEPKRIGASNRKDGGVDIVFWPRAKGSFPFLGAAQVKHHGNQSYAEGPGTVRDFAGAMATHKFSAGLIVTNTSFTPDARWFARKQGQLLRLRDLGDLRRWLRGEFGEEEWREIPSEIELCPGVVVRIRN
jgi:hypothetical protein